MNALLVCHNTEVPEAGIDEAGRGCYAGPVYAAAVILPPDFFHPLLNDSKQLKPRERDILRPIIEQEAIAWSVAAASPELIDRINILQATYHAMHEAVSRLSVSPGALLVDGKWFKPYRGLKHTCMVGGDGRYANIAAASILAKTYRDAYMGQLHAQFPQYGWDQNKGYGTSAHREAISRFGLCAHHRKSFNISGQQLELFDS